MAPPGRSQGGRLLQRLTAVEKEEDLASPKLAGNDRLQRAFDNSPALHIGESGEAVRLIQEVLVDDGFDMPGSTKPTGELDGQFGQETFDVLKLFQEKHALDVDGIVGRQTLREMDQLEAARESDGPPLEPVPEGESPEPSTPPEKQPKVEPAPEPQPPESDEAEEDDPACPVDVETVETLVADAFQSTGPQSLAGNLLGFGPSVRAGPGRPAGIQEAVTRFKERVNVRGVEAGLNVTDTGQFFWSQQVRRSLQLELDRMASGPGQRDKAVADFAREGQDLRKSIGARIVKTKEELDKRITGLRAIVSRMTSPDDRARAEALLRESKKSKEALENLLWDTLRGRPDDPLPDLSPHRTFDAFLKLRTFETAACGDIAHRIFARLKQRGGIRPRDPRVPLLSVRVAGFGAQRNRLPIPSPKGLLQFGDLIDQPNIAPKIQQLREALGAGQVVEARVLSGVGYNSAKKEFDEDTPNPDAKKSVKRLGAPPEEHSILIIGNEGTRFVFFDPDSVVSKTPEPGFGILFESDGRFSTAANRNDLLVTASGRHETRNEKRYQVRVTSRSVV